MPQKKGTDEMWFFATIIVTTAATLQIIHFIRRKSSIKEWTILGGLYAFIYIGIAFCAIELDSPIPRLIEWMTPFINYIYQMIG